MELANKCFRTAIGNMLRDLNKNSITFFLSEHETFSSIDHMLGHKTSFNKLKKSEIISSIFSDYSVIKLEIN